MLHLRAIVPAERTEAVCKELAACAGATNIVVIEGAARAPRGDLVTADIARESANEVLDALRTLGVDRDGSIALDKVDLTLSDRAELAKDLAPGHGDDAVVWEELDRQVSEGTALTWSFVAFLVLATQLAAIAALIDSPVLVVGAMVLGPEFAAIAAICYGLVRLQPGRIVHAVRALVIGFAVAIAVTYACALAARWTGVIELDRLPDDRPLTAFIYSPDRWSFIVALLAGAAGVLSLTAGKSSALVGVFISVTTVPAAGNLAVAMALKHGSEVNGSLLQLGVNVAGMIIAGTLTLLLQRAVWYVVLRQRGRRNAVRGT
ncbi:putative hydrophobic protein (TIGR00271 family) [Actinomadura coerulea]|uniref:Putative hydrophobic protein (TIGR00271 family) n=1 Tax=Actinomadura coerulea TaxID=46159 RepID=A0A7X0L148_9ACTN|nr:putative hydrophobic protein (TIGR00271 family) [Actinomadura coerulea]